MKNLSISFLSLSIFLIGFSSSQNCIGTVDNYSYDFTSLRNSTGDYVIQMLNGTNPFAIRINMCGPLNNLGTPPCLAGASGCQLWDMPKPTFRKTLGMASTMTVSTLSDNTGNMIGYQAYFTGGQNGNTPVSMAINLLCDAQESQGPSIVSTSNNFFLFEWNTTTACPLRCQGNIDGVSYDLLALSDSNSDYVIYGTGSDSYIIRLNLCRSLIDLGNPPCLDGASACFWNYSRELEVTTMGLADTVKFSLIQQNCENVGLQATYSNGMNQMNQTVGMSIDFFCDEGAGIGQPVYLSSHGDFFQFVWNTEAVCGISRPIHMTKHQALQAFAEMDNNHDGYISQEELLARYVRD